VRLCDLGHEVTLGSRDPARAEAVRAKLVAKWPDHDLSRLRGADNAGAASAEIVVVATPWEGAAPTVKALAPAVEGKVVICMANALTRVGKEFQPLIPARGSVAADVAAAVPASRVVAAFHHVPARELGDLDGEVDCDVLVCSVDDDATGVVVTLAEAIPGMRAVNAGRLTAAGPVEALTAVLIGMNVRYKAHLSIRLSGLADPPGHGTR
jgi:NADPH-dependent F420 reductase